MLDETGILSLRGEDASGGFGILPGHADYVTVIDAGVLRWRGESGPWRYCVVRGLSSPFPAARRSMSPAATP
ncbi:hypothetical protein ACFSZS_11465 [Seohaeicola zhoushanensis]